MSITKDGNGNIVETEMEHRQRANKTGVHDEGHFAVCDASDVLKQIKLDPTAQTTDTTVTIASGANTSDITLTLPTASDTLEGRLTTDGVGAKNGSTVTAVEKGNAALHQTVLTLASTPVAVTSTTTANGFGGVKLYDLPEGNIRIHGCTASLSVTVAAAEQANFTDGTPEGDLGIGSVIIANADAMGTDATDDDYSTATAFTMTAFTDADVGLPPEASANFDGTSTAKDINLNVLVDAADIDDDASTAVEVSGTVTIHWSNLGDY